MEKTLGKVGAVGAAALIATMGLTPVAFAAQDGHVGLGEVANIANETANHANPNSDTGSDIANKAANTQDQSEAADLTNLSNKWKEGTSGDKTSGAVTDVKILKTIQAPAAAGASMEGQAFTFNFRPLTTEDEIYLAHSEEDQYEVGTYSAADQAAGKYDTGTWERDQNNGQGNPNWVAWDTSTGLDVGTPIRQNLGPESEVGVYPIPDATTCAIAPITLTAEGMDDNADVQYIEGQVALPEAVNFVHAGIYEYEVTEEAETGHSSVTTGGEWVESQSKYLMRVYVINNPDSGVPQSSLVIDAVTVEKLVDTVTDPTSSDWGTAFDAEEKVNPEDDGFNNEDYGTDNTNYPSIGKSGQNENDNTPTGESARRASGFNFTNSYIDVDNELLISKIVKGNFGDKTELFDFNVVLEVPAYVPQSYVDAIVADNTLSIVRDDGTIDPALANTQQNTGDNPNATVIPAKSAIQVSGHTVTINGFKLHGNSMVKIANLPLGTTYTVVENSTKAHYTATSTFGNISTDGVVDPHDYDKVGANTGASAGKNSQVSVNVAQSALGTPIADRTPVAQTTTILDGSNKVEVTNTFDDTDISPTGIITQALPYLVLIAVPAAGLLYIAARRRKQED